MTLDFTLRVAGIQIEAAAAATPWKSTPGYNLALGGGSVNAGGSIVLTYTGVSLPLLQPQGTNPQLLRQFAF